MYTKLYRALNAILISELRMYSFLLPGYSYQGFYKVGVILFHVPHTALESFFFISAHVLFKNQSSFGWYYF